MIKTYLLRISAPAVARLLWRAAVAGSLLAGSATALSQGPATPTGIAVPLGAEVSPDYVGMRKVQPESPALVENLAEAPPVLPPPSTELPIDLCTALRVAETDNPTIGVSRAAIQEAVALQLKANGLLLPTLRTGTNYHLHDGVLQSSSGLMRHGFEQSLYAGAGASTLGSQTVAFPGIQLFSPLADAFFAPVIARRELAVRQARLAATNNQVLLDVSGRFLELVSAEAELSAIRETQRDANRVVQLTAAFAKAGQGREADAKRTQALAQLLRGEEERSEERVGNASAALAELLNLDPATRLRSPAGGTGMVQLVDPNAPLPDLVMKAQLTRPELAAIRAEISRLQAQVKQERFRPLLPTVSIGYSYGTFGGSTNRTDLVPNNAHWDNFNQRTDFDVLAYWTVQNFGAGNLALVHQREAERGAASAEQIRIINEVRREVVSAQSRVEAGRRRVDIAYRQLKVAQQGFRADLTRIEGGVGLPIEVVNSIDRLLNARRNVIASLLEYNLGEFQLFVALGQNPSFACSSDDGACAAH